VRVSSSRRLPPLARYLLAHLAAYPLAFLWAVASIPLAIHLSAPELDALHDDLPAIGDLIVRRVAWPAAAAFVLPHLLALSWAFGGGPERRTPSAWLAIAAVGVAGVIFGGASWIWLFVRGA